MASYEVKIKRSVAKDLRRIPRPHLEKILQCIDSLAKDPRPPGCEKLSNQERYRVRPGPYRILYEIQDDRLIVIVVQVGHRKNIYRR